MTKSIIDEYLFYQEKYTKIYGNKTIVFMMIGGFYEAYGTDTRGYDLNKISEITNLVKSKRDKKITRVDEKNPYMVGFNITALDKFLKIMIDNGFTVIIIDQVTAPPNPKREVVGIYSPGTYIGDSNLTESNNLVSIYIEDEKQITGNYLTCIGMSSVDLSTGESSVYEVFSTIGDEKFALDECYRFIISHNPKEVIITRKEIQNISMSKEELLVYLELENKSVQYITGLSVNKNFHKISYQNEFFGKVYKDHDMETPIEYLDLEKMSYARLSFIVLLDFAYKHNENFINNLDKPTLFSNSKYLVLGNNAIYQLNILENNALETSNIKFKCLFDVVNQTSTAMGRRFLKHTLCRPLNDIDAIELRYNCIEELIKNSLYEKLEKHLVYILDIEKLSRKIFLSSIHPCEFANLLESFEEIDNILKLIKDTKYNSKFIPEKIIFDQLVEFIDSCKKTFNINELKRQYITDIQTSFFLKGVYNSIDELNAKVDTDIQFLKEVCVKLGTYIDDNPRFSKKNEGNEKIKLLKDKKEGYYLSMTKKRAHCLKTKLENVESIKINDHFSVDPKKMEYKELKTGNTKIFFKDFYNKSDNVILLKEKLIKLIKDKYLNILANYSKKYKNMFRSISKFIAQIDFIKSCAKISQNYNYCKPQIITNKEKYYSNGFIDCKKIRHPIVERIRTDVEYVSHDIILGDTHNNDNPQEGILIYGVNAVGKSTLMKAIGLNLIMAQCGMYVPAQEFKYSPYEGLFARITGNDNLFKNQSSFTLEMTELKAILKRAGPKTIVIGDELTKGTEHISGNAIVAASIITLSKSHSSFIFATHLHDVVNIKRVQELQNVKFYHLSIHYDPKNDILVFDRLLKPGVGESIYGLTIARYILKDNEFIKLAQEIKNELINIPNTILNDKKSNYNSNVFMHECALCGVSINESNMFSNALDTHHIVEQNKFNENKFTEGREIKKDNKSNLIVICKICHHKIHDSKEFQIKGYLDTSKGRKLLVKNSGHAKLKNQNIIVEE